MAFRGKKPAVKPGVPMDATVISVDKVVNSETGEVRYYKVQTSLGEVNLGAGAEPRLKERWDYDDIMDIVGQTLDFKYEPNKDTSFGDFQLNFVLGRVVEGTTAEQSAEAKPKKKGW